MLSIVIIEISLDLVQAIATVQVECTRAYIYVYLETIVACIALLRQLYRLDLSVSFAYIAIIS